MFKKILLIFTILSCFFSSNLVFGSSLRDKLLNSKNSGVKDVTLEFKIEDVDKEDVLLDAQAIWIGENGQKIGIKNLGKTISLDSFSRKIPQNESRGFLLIQNSKNGNQLSSKVKIPLKYSDFNGTQTEKRLLYYIQFEHDLKKKKYNFVKYYTEGQLQEELEKKEQIEDVEINGIIKAGYTLNEVTLGFYNKNGELIAKTQSDFNGAFSLKIQNYKDKIILGKEYFLIWHKSGNIEEEDIGILTEGNKYIFKNYRDIFSEFNKQLKIDAKLNQKDIIKSEPFPYIFLIFLVIIYFIGVWFVFKLVIQKVFIHPLLNKKQEVIFKSRKNKILELKEKINLE